MIIKTLHGIKRWLYITLFFSLFIFGCANGTAVLRGVVTDSSSGDALLGVLVRTDDGLAGMSNVDGEYTISHPPGSVGLSTSFAGYATYTDVVTFVASTTVFKAIALNKTCTDSDGDGAAVEGGSCGAIDCDDNNANLGPDGPPVRNARTLTYYETAPILETAYNQAGPGDTIQSKNVTLTENLNIGQDKVIGFVGGYNCDYSSIIGDTTISGAVATNGISTIQNFIVSGTGTTHPPHPTSTIQNFIVK